MRRGSKHQPGGRGRRAFRMCSTKGCGRSYYGPAPWCPSCRVTFREKYLQLIGAIVVILLISFVH